MFAVAHRVNSAPRAETVSSNHAVHVELDVRLNGANVVLSHFQKVIWAHGWLERDNARVRIRRGPPSDAPIEAVLALLPSECVIVFDPKDREPTTRARLVDVLARTVDDPTRHVISSRDQRDLDMFGSVGFGTWRTVDTGDQIRAITRDGLAADGVTVRQRALTAETVRALHSVTETVVAWTVNRVPRALELARFGVDGVTTDRLEVMAAARRAA